MARKLTAIIDTREQLPLDLKSEGFEIVSKKLDYGDYSLWFPRLTNIVAYERKSLSDFIACCGKERARFQRELIAMRGFKHKAVVIECEFREVLEGNYRSNIDVKCVIASVARWESMGVPFKFTGSREGSKKYISHCFRVIAKDVFEYAKEVTQ